MEQSQTCEKSRDKPPYWGEKCKAAQNKKKVENEPGLSVFECLCTLCKDKLKNGNTCVEVVIGQVSPRGQSIPNTVRDWKHYAYLIQDLVMSQRKTIGKLEAKVNKLQQKKNKK